jgi:hypothetical protein
VPTNYNMRGIKLNLRYHFWNWIHFNLEPEIQVVNSDISWYISSIWWATKGALYILGLLELRAHAASTRDEENLGRYQKNNNVCAEN